jgi:putative aldouronate transport system permease protein
MAKKITVKASASNNRIRRTFGEQVFDAVNIVIMLSVIVITIYPIFYVLVASFSDPGRLVASSGLLFRPLGFHTMGYQKVFENPLILFGYKNTILYTSVGTCINIIMTTLAAFVLSRKRFYLRHFFMFIVTFTMFFSGGLIPTYLQVRTYGLYNTMWALILPGAMSAWNMIIMRTSFLSIPDSLEESARIDGATNLTILLRIILPLSTAIVAIMVLFYAVAHWNSWFSAMIYLRTRTKYPLQLVLREVLIANMTDSMSAGESSSERQALGEVIKYAMIIVATVPILLIYPFLQKYFVKGVMVGAIKE